MAEWIAHLLTVWEVSHLNPSIPPLLNACRECDQLPCWLPRHWKLSHQRWIWEIHCPQVRKYTSKASILALKLRPDITRSPKQGYQWLSYPELELHLVNLDLTPSEHNPDHVQGPKWAPVMVDWSTHWAPSARVHHYHNTWYLILELTRTRADYCMTHSCNHTTRSTTNKDHLITSMYTVVSVITAT